MSRCSTRLSGQCARQAGSCQAASPRYLDVVATYQHAGRTQADQTARTAFWHCLDQTLHSLAHRHELVLGGDFNCSLTAGYPHTGTHVFTHCGRQTLAWWLLAAGIRGWQSNWGSLPY